MTDQPPVKPSRHHIWHIAKRTLSKSWDDSIFSESAQAAFWCALSLPPLLLGMLGSLVMLMFVAVPPETPVYGLDARYLALGGGAVYSIGWLFFGWSILRSRLFSRGDGLLLMLAAPLLGAGGVWLAPLHTLGALLTLAAGIGIAWASGRLVPSVGRVAAKSRPAAAPARVAVSG